MSKKKVEVHSGMHKDFVFTNYTEEEVDIIHQAFAPEFYVTNSGREFFVGNNSIYRYFLIKFATNYQHLFNIEREIIVLFSPYKQFEPRTLDAFDQVYDFHQELRIERLVCFLVSKDSNIQERISSLLKTSTESRVIVPFNYVELLSISDEHFFRNRIRNHFYSRDLFAYDSALKTDLYFFGRNDLVHMYANRHRACENSGLFGLRKTGKTSIIFGIQRALKANKEFSVYIDCQDTSFYLKRWYHALYYLANEIRMQGSIACDLSDISQYTPENASSIFEMDLKNLKSKGKFKSVLLIFDEVERITFDTSLSEHWRNGYDFIHFWRSLRALFQKLGYFTYLLVSTNPKSIETPAIHGEDNPIFTTAPLEYIPPFTVDQTREMVSKLSSIMGLEFDDIIYGKMNEEFGGHPFLIRIVCSVIHRISPRARPVRVDKSIYEKAVEAFNSEYASYIEMVINILDEFYPDEFEMLKLLANNDYETFGEFAEHSPLYTVHLLGYNVIDQNQGSYSFQIESIRKYLANKSKYKKLNLSNEDMLKEISERRNNIEPKLRNIIRTVLLSNHGEIESKNIVLSIFGDPRKHRLSVLPYKSLFDPNKSEIYLEDLRKIILSKWNNFEHIFLRNKTEFDNNMTVVNKLRADAHAKKISKEDMNYFRVCMTKLEEQVNEYLQS